MRAIRELLRASVVVGCLTATRLAAQEPPATRAVETAEPVRQIVCPISVSNPRNGEGDITVLRDGRWLLAYSHFMRGAAADDAPAEIHARTSADRGKTWSADSVLIPNDAMNLMSVSFLRLRNGELMLVYGRRHSNSLMTFHARFSTDEGETWSADSLVTPNAAYQTINNGRIIQLQDGRLLAPVAMCRGKSWKDDYFFFDTVTWSDDNGRTWHAIPQRLTVKGCSYGADEPALIELKDGRVMMLIRTDVGQIFRSYSKDSGATWSEPEPTGLASPSSPASIARIASTGELLLVWNNAKPLAANAGEPRNPLTSAISADEGQTWKQIKNIENSDGADYCYTSITFDGDDVIQSYYERGSLKVCVTNARWFTRDGVGSTSAP
ncbi:MAG TPA: sialidase family protein [Tepidisphaeraceae bacterium]|jgi:hypothetical protein